MIVALLLIGCGGWGSAGAPCQDDGDCSGQAICDETLGTCRDVECIDSSQCPLGNHCDGTHVCRTGCLEDGDCLAGESCDTASSECILQGCRTTELDCHYGEFCEVETGQCYADLRDHCAPAETTSEQLDCQYGGGIPACWQTDASGACSGEYHCLQPCDPGLGADACPRGLDCVVPFAPPYDIPVCHGDCPWLVDNGL